MSNMTSKRGVAALLASAVVASVLSVSAASAATCDYVFNRNLKKGSTGVDVMNLQKVLNMDSATTVALSGAGSAGNETSYFGSATHLAVIKFQEKYASEILTPVGLTRGSGLVYASTRAKLNAICAGTGNNNNNNGGNTNAGPLSVSAATSQPSNVVVAGQSGAVLGNFVLSGNGTVKDLQLTRTGVSANSTLVNVYLYDGATRLTDAASVSSDGIIRINNANIAVNGSRTLTVRADIASGTQGQIVGVNVSNMTPMGGSATAVTAVGPLLTVAQVSTASFALTQNATNLTSGTALTINAGVTNQNLHDISANVGTRAVWLKGMTYKFVGSAPTSAVSNLGLYVDGSMVASGSLDSNNRVVFNLMNTPKYLQTGNHQIQLRGDITGGSYREFQFSIENMADIMAEDSNLTGVNVTPTGLTFPVYGNYYKVQQGQLTLNIDPAFTATQLVPGASNAVVGQFKYTAYGEDVKIETVQINPMYNASSTGSLQNVTLYVNGGAVGATQNWTGGTLTFNLGSQFIVPAGQSAILTVKADLRDTNGNNLTSGTLQVNDNTTLARGMSSQITTSASVTGRVLTISSNLVAFAKTSGFVAQNVSPNTAGVKVGSFTVQSGNAEDIVVTSLGANVTTSSSTANPATNYSNLRLADSSNIFGQVTTGTSTFSMNVTVPKNTTKTFDIYADLGSVPSGQWINVAAGITYRGVNSGMTGSLSDTGVNITSNTASLNTPTRLSSSPVSQLQVGNTTSAIATFNVTASNGSATITDLGFTTSPSNAITSITVGGVTSAVINGGTTYVRGLSIAVPQGGAGADIPVTVTYGNVATNGGIVSQTATTTSVTLAYVKGMSGNTTIESGIATSSVSYPAFATVSSNSMQLVASKPTLTVPNTTLSGLGNTETKIGEVTVAADASGNIKVNDLNFNTTVTTGITLTGARIADGSTTIAGSACTGGVGAVTCEFGTSSNTDGDGYSIAAGTSKTFSLYATVGGVAGASGTASVSTKLTGLSWDDVNGGGTDLNGSAVYNFPTGSYSVRN